MGVATLATAAALVAAGVFVGTNIASAAPSDDRSNRFRGLAVWTESNAATFTSTSWTDLTTQVIVPDTTQTLLITFSAETLCGGQSGWCTVRILVDGFEAKPAVGTDFAFDSGNDSYEVHTMQRVATVGGFNVSRQIKVQVAVQGTGMSFRVDDWTLSVVQTDSVF